MRSNTNKHQQHECEPNKHVGVKIFDSARASNQPVADASPLHHGGNGEVKVLFDIGSRFVHELELEQLRHEPATKLQSESDERAALSDVKESRTAQSEQKATKVRVRVRMRTARS